MSIVTDLVRRWEVDVDRLTQAHFVTTHDDDEDVGHRHEALAAAASPQLERLLTVSKALRSTSSSHPLLTAPMIRGLLWQSGLIQEAEEAASVEQDGLIGAVEKSYIESEAEWLIISLATVQCYGILLDTLLDQIMPLNNDIWYWDEVLSSYTSLSVYTVQTSPLRLWARLLDMKDGFGEGWAQFRQTSPAGALEAGRANLSQQWRQFYAIVRQTVVERSLQDIQKRVLSPIAGCRADAIHNRKRLKRFQQLISSGLGILTDEGLRFNLKDDTDEAAAEIHAENGRKWKGIVVKSVSLMDQVTKSLLQFENAIPQFEDKVFNDVEEDDLQKAIPGDHTGQPARIAMRLDMLLSTGIPEHASSLDIVASEYGRPSVLVRYWLPASILFLSSSTILRIVANRREDVIAWISGAAETAKDFWFNWVVEPVGKVIRTIRHDDSEIAIMSKDSLKADRESLERMVVDFAMDKPQAALGQSTVTEAQVADIRAKVREGDVTPVLRAYENDLRKPFVGAVRGDLVRSLLIQVQKTKVDLEVAISGIDSLLKSQELVFGMVGLTPGVLISLGLFQYLRGIFWGRRSVRRSKRAGRINRVLRNIDRIFFEAETEASNNMLSYKHRGLLLCEAHVLRSLVRGVLPAQVEKEFLEDLDDVICGPAMNRQIQALNMLWRDYSTWWK